MAAIQVTTETSWVSSSKGQMMNHSGMMNKMVRMIRPMTESRGRP